MVEYNKYEDLKEQQHISNLIDGVPVSLSTEQTPQTSSVNEKFVDCQYDDR